MGCLGGMIFPGLYSAGRCTLPLSWKRFQSPEGGLQEVPGINPSKGHQFTAGLSVPARGVSTWQGYWSLAGVLVPIRGFSPQQRYLSL